MSGFCVKSEDTFLKFIPLFGKLQILNMSRSFVEDNCLRLLGVYCKDLR